MSKTSRLCRVSAAAFPCAFLRLRERSQSEGRAKAERRHSGKTRTGLTISRPFPNAKIARINDMANFFEQKMSLFPLLKKRGSLWWQKRLSWVKKEWEGWAAEKRFSAWWARHKSKIEYFLLSIWRVNIVFYPEFTYSYTNTNNTNDTNKDSSDSCDSCSKTHRM